MDIILLFFLFIIFNILRKEVGLYMQTAVKIPDFVFQTSHLTPDEFILELAISLFKKQNSTIGQASRLCKLSQYQFQHILASRDISIHYYVEGFNKNETTLKSLGLILKLSQLHEFLVCYDK